MMSRAAKLLVGSLAWLLALPVTGANLQFESADKSGQAYMIEIAQDADFSKIVHTSKSINSARYKWTGAVYDAIYHWRIRGAKSKEVLGRGTYVVIGPGSGFVSLMWDDHELATDSFDLTTDVIGRKASLERVAQNWSTRKRIDKAQLVSIRPAAMKSAHASFVASLTLTMGKTENAVQVISSRTLPKTRTKRPAAAPVEVKPATVENLSKTEVKEPAKPTPILMPRRKEEPVLTAAAVVRNRPSAVALGMPTSRLMLALGGEYAQIMRSKAEVEVDSARGSGRMDLEYSGEFAGRGILSLALHQSSSQARATVESDFALPEINLPSSDRRIELMLGLKLWQAPRFRLGIGLSAAQNQNWAIALAYSSLDGGALFEQHTYSSAGLRVISEYAFNQSLVTRLQLGAHSGLEDTESRQYISRADLLYRIVPKLELGASGGIDRLDSKRCHGDPVVCDREGRVTANESRAYMQLVVGYAWGGTPSN